jgi:hypothetical protein
MMEKPHAAVRLIRDFAHFPVTGITINWREGQVIEDPAVIALLTGINVGHALPAARAALAEAEAAAKSTRAALARFQAEIEMRRRIGIAAKVDAAIAALAAALKEFDGSGQEIAGLDLLPHGMFGTASISRVDEIAGARRIRAALPKTFLRYYPGALHEERPAMSLEASEIQVWSLPEKPAAKAA